MKILMLIVLLFNTISVHAKSPELILPAPGQMVSLSKPYVPISLKGLRIDPQNPLRFDFILHEGGNKISPVQMQEQGMTLVKYFLAALTMPEEDVWVNLSPFEQDRIIPQELSRTLLGRDMLIQDYLLKQLTSSLLYPNSDVGREFWKKVYTQAKSGMGGAQIPISSFNKVWIMPDRARVYTKGETMVITDSHLKVMLDHDYHAIKKSQASNRIRLGQQEVAEQAMREVIVPILEKEINEGENFALLRQIFQAAILAEWYKRHFKQGILGQQYANQHKVGGIDETPVQFKEDLYNQYLKAYKKGVYNFIREDKDPSTGIIIPRKYFSGGLTVNVSRIFEERTFDAAQGSEDFEPQQVQYNNGLGQQNSIMLGVNMMPNVGQVDSLLPRQWISAYRKEVSAIIENVVVEDTSLKSIVHDINHKNVRVSMHQYDAGGFGVRVANSNLSGVPKGGERWIKPSILMRSKEFRHAWQEFLKTKPTIEQGTDFLKTWFLEKAESLSIMMTLKTAGFNANLGGAKGDVFFGRIESWQGTLVLKDLLEMDIPAVARERARKFTEMEAIGINIDSPAPDIGSGADIMALYTDEMIKVMVEKGIRYFLKDVTSEKKMKYQDKYIALFKELKNIQVSDINQTPYVDAIYKFWQNNLKQEQEIPVPWLGVFTGLALNKGGVAGREAATGDGVAIVTEAYYKAKGEDPRDKTVAVQGFGNVGSFAAIAMARKGFKVTVINDFGITLIKRSGFTLQDLQAINGIKNKKKVILKDLWHQGLLKVDGIEAIFNDDPHHPNKVTEAVLFAPVDILIPAALEEEITVTNVKGIKASLIVEGANNPVTPEALEILDKELKVDVIPGILANAGGVFVSGLQIEQARSGRQLSKKEVSQRLSQVLSKVLLSLVHWRATYRVNDSLYEAYVHYMLTILNIEKLKRVKDANEGRFGNMIVISRASFEKHLHVPGDHVIHGGDIFDQLNERGYFETLPTKYPTVAYSMENINVIAEGVARIYPADVARTIQHFLRQLSEGFVRRDAAMVDVKHVSPTGGIDLNTSDMNIDEQGSVVNFDTSQVSQTLENIQGLVPVFIQMRTISMSALLGL